MKPHNSCDNSQIFIMCIVFFFAHFGEKTTIGCCCMKKRQREHSSKILLCVPWNKVMSLGGVNDDRIFIIFW